MTVYETSERSVMDKKDVLKPQGKKIYNIEDLIHLPLNDKGEIHVPEGGILMGPDGKWWIDEEGNAYFGGEMTVCKDVDPQYCQLDNQNSATGVPTRSLVVVNQNLEYKNSSSVQEDVPLGTVSGNHPTVFTSISNNIDPFPTVPTTFGTNTESVSITPSSTNVDIFVMGMFFGNDETGGDIPGVRLVRGSTALTTWTARTTTNTIPSYWGGMLAHVDSPATTSSTTYGLQFDGDGSERIHHSSLVVFECIGA